MKFAGERRALAAIVFVFYAIAYLGLAMWSAQPALGPSLYALGAVYGLAFFALVAGYFWARWYAIGVGIYGVIVGALGMWQVGAEPIIVFIGATHVLAVVMLWGQGTTCTSDSKQFGSWDSNGAGPRRRSGAHGPAILGVALVVE